MYLIYVQISIFRDIRSESRTVQGQPMSKVMMPIDSAWVVLYSTSINHIIVSVTVFEIFDVKF